MKKKAAAAQENYRMPDLSRSTPKTDPELIRLVQSALRPKVSLGASNKDIASLYIGDADFRMGDSAKIKFDTIYRPFVYKVLVARRDKGGLGFVMETEVEQGSNSAGGSDKGKGQCAKSPGRRTISIPVKHLEDGRTITAEEVYSNVYMRLFGGKKPALLGFDTSRDRVGRGAFRHWLRLIVKCAFFDMCRVPKIILKDLKGHVIYQRDKQGRYVLDGEGRKVPCYVRDVSSSTKIDDDDPENDMTIVDTLAAPESPEARRRRKKAERTFWMARIDLRYIAYVSALERLRKGSWFRDVLVALYEKGLPYKVVKAECLKKGIAVGTFDKAYCDWNKRFLDACERIEATIRRKGEDRMASGKRVSRAQLIGEAWDRLAEFVGKSRVQDIRFRVIRNLIAGFSNVTNN